MSVALTPERWAIDITKLLTTVLGADRFPVDVAMVAKEYSAKRWANDPIVSVKGDNLPGFDGGLFKAPAPKKGWGIIYNSAITSPGRINFTLAHEFGHYLLHRLRYPDGIRCSQDAVAWHSEHGQVEHQANVFAANLLMPLDDFRRQIPERAAVEIEMISQCADRYRVSLMAAALRWLDYTAKRALLVVSRDGYILWSRSSMPALQSGAFFRTSAGRPQAIPSVSLAARQDMALDNRLGLQHAAGVWLDEPAYEMTVFSEQYDFVLSLLLLEDQRPRAFGHRDEDEEPDTFDRMVANTRRNA